MAGASKVSGRKVALFAVMGGALALTVNGEVAAVAPMLGTGFGAVLAAVFALSTLLALNYVIDGTGPVRFWAWLVLLLAGGMELGLNTWHALTTVLVDAHGVPLLDEAGRPQPALPTLAAVAVGAGPVLLAGLLSHLVALTVSAETPAPPAPPVPAAPPTAAPVPTPVVPVVRTERVETAKPVRATATRTGTPAGTPTRARKAVTSGTRTAPKPVRADEELLAILSYPELVARDADGTVPVRRAARELGCGVDRARKLLAQTGLLATDPADTDVDAGEVEVVQPLRVVEVA
ncbi:hypothetical protein [Umezawaea beigongshangensis]|uniref:hypothetical protein n=1 Tax=Umezawaea beigongshangensis TaxID=2780383 RepID=UPI0018F117BA|nr:hypothetical protein [Umezawaea beigongshangensis]